MKFKMILGACLLGMSVQAELDGIRWAKPQRQDFAETVRWYGVAVNRNQAEVVALGAGQVESIVAKEGESVEKGDLLLTVGGELIDSRKAVLDARVSALEQRVGQNQKMIAMQRKAVEQKLAKYATLATAENEGARLGAELESARQELKQLDSIREVRASVAGVFADRRVAVGQWVQSGDVLGEILPDTPVLVRATLFPKVGTQLKGKEVTIERLGKGSIVRVLPQVTAEGATMVWIETEKSGLKPGQIVSGSVLLAEHRQALAVPSGTVVYDDAGQAYLFLKTSGGYEKRAVETGLVSKDWIEIASGLSPSDAVVVQGAYELFHSNFNQLYKVVD